MHQNKVFYILLTSYFEFTLQCQFEIRRFLYFLQKSILHTHIKPHSLLHVAKKTYDMQVSEKHYTNI